MIIKFSHGVTKETERWEVFGDVDRYSVNARFCSKMVDAVTEFGVVSLRSVLDFTEAANQNQIWELSLFRGDKKPIDIMAHSPIFILNNEGRTVDKI
jgi:hypothetical protein